jgi:hypothetical protein
MLDAAAHGVFPPADGVVDVLPAPPGTSDAVVAFTGHFVVAADVDPPLVRERLPHGDFSAPLSPAFLHWLSNRLGRHPSSHDAVLCAIGDGAGAPDWLVRDDGVAHPRVARAARSRDLVSVWAVNDGAGVLALGRGLCGRWEFGYEIEPEAQGRRLGRALAAAVRSIVPAGEPVWAQVAPGNAASLRSTLAAGFVPIGAEVLFARDAPPAPSNETPE